MRDRGVYRWRSSALMAFAGLCFSCASPPPTSPANTIKARDEAKASRLLARARATHDPERYRQIIARFGDTRAAEDARQDLSVILVSEAKAAVGKKDWATADDHAEEARIYANLETTRQAIAIENQIDDGRGAEVAQAAARLAAEDKCASALKVVAAPLRKKPRARFRKVVQEQSRKPLVDCLTRKLTAEVNAGDLEPARAMIETPDATTALSNVGYRQVRAALQKLMVRRSTSGIQPLLAEHKWRDAIAKLGEMRKARTITTDEYGVAFAIVQDAIRKYLLEVAQKGLTAPKPSRVMDDLDAEARIAGWKTLPDDLEAARSLLAVAVECERLHCRLQKPAPAWAWGAIAVHPPELADGPAKSQLHHAEKIWVVAKGRKHELIALKDPGRARGRALYQQVAGWVEPAHLESVDTKMWLPPTDQLAGARVWGPLRPPSKDYHLGVVQRVEGKKVVVRRLSDALDTTVDLKSLRVGQLPKGLRVMAFCTDQLHTEPARVDSIVTAQGGVPKVKFTCDHGGLTRVDLGGSLTSKAAWLPPRRP